MNNYEPQEYYIPTDRDIPPIPQQPPYLPYGEPYYYEPPMEPSEKKASGGKKLLIFALCFSLLGSLLGGAAVLLLQKALAPSEDQLLQNEKTQVSYLLEGQREQVALETIPVASGTEMTPAQVYAANVHSTVGITTTSTTTNFWGYQTTSAASGSGFIISNDGYILTNYHVIEGSDSISVSLFSGTNYEAKLIGYDESNDIAVLKVEAQDLVPVVLGDSDKMNVGDTVVAIGNPLGELTFSLTSGSISAKDREVTFDRSISMKLIQTDCAINSGNSGGALFNLYGEVIGVTNAKYSGSSSATIDNIGFAIPLNSIRDIVQSIIVNGYIVKPYAGVSVSDLGFEAQFYGLPMGALVRAVDSAGPAASLLQEGDIIVAVQDSQINSGSQFIHLVEASQAGEVLKLTVYRQGQYTDLQLTITETRRSALPNTQQGSYY